MSALYPDVLHNIVDLVISCHVIINIIIIKVGNYSKLMVMSYSRTLLEELQMYLYPLQTEGQHLAVPALRKRILTQKQQNK